MTLPGTRPTSTGSSGRWREIKTTRPSSCGLLVMNRARVGTSLPCPHGCTPETPADRSTTRATTQALTQTCTRGCIRRCLKRRRSAATAIPVPCSAAHPRSRPGSVPSRSSCASTPTPWVTVRATSHSTSGLSIATHGCTAGLYGNGATMDYVPERRTGQSTSHTAATSVRKSMTETSSSTVSSSPTPHRPPASTSSSPSSPPYGYPLSPLKESVPEANLSCACGICATPPALRISPSVGGLKITARRSHPVSSPSSAYTAGRLKPVRKQCSGYRRRARAAKERPG